MRKVFLLLSTIMSLCSYANGITSVGATKEILASNYYDNAAYTAMTYTVEGGSFDWSYVNYNVVLGTPPTDAKGRQWYESAYQPTDGDYSWEEHQAPFSSDAYYNGKPSYQWTTSDVSAEIYIRRSFTVTEAITGDVYLSAGHDDAPAEFYINGTLVYQVADGWNAAEFALLSDEAKACIKTDGSENILAVHIHNNYGGAYADCGLYEAAEQVKDGTLAMGYDVSWTGKVLYNSEGGYNTGGLHDWPVLYEAKSGDTYTISLPTATDQSVYGKVQFKTPINIDASHNYTFKATLTANQDMEIFVNLAENEDESTILASNNQILTANSPRTVSYQSLTGHTISDLMIYMGFGTDEDNAVIKVSDISIYDNTEGKELWTGTSYYNWCYYADPTTGSRIKDMEISGRTETLSWTLPDFDDSMWQSAAMPIGNYGFMSEVKTIWPGSDNTNYWIRRTFQLEKLERSTKYVLKVCHDDNYTVYVNGHMLESAEGWTSGKEYASVEVPASYLQLGTNVIAVYQEQNYGGRFFDCGMAITENYYEESDYDADPKQLMANEICVANIDQKLDYSFNYGGWIELYNNSDKRFDLSRLYISDEADNLTKFKLVPSTGVVKPHGYRCIFFDHNSSEGTYGDTAEKQVSFKLNNDGGTIYFSEDGVTPVITATYPAGISRCSYARKSVDSDEWGMNGEPTPNAANSSRFAKDRLSAPVVDTDSRLFSEGFDISVTIPQGATLRYTTDGTAPTYTNGKVSTDGKFSISKSSNYRFRLFEDGYLPSPVVTRSYIYRDNDYYLPVVSITTDPDNLYSDSIGVYVDGVNGVSGRNHGKSNINMDWERPVNFEYITADNKMGVNLEAEFTISGGWSRHYAPAAFKIKATKVNEGVNSIDYPFFPCKPYNKYKQILVRNGGNDNDASYHGRVRDAITQETLISSGFYVDAQDYQPVHVFFNGKYIGQLNLREPNNRYNGTANYGYDDDEMDAFEYSNGYFQMAGTKDAFNEWLQLSQNADDEETYNTICEKVDMDEYTNFWAAISYIGCSDWICNNNNLKGYRSLPDGKFHLTLLDQDWGWSNTSALNTLNGNYGNEMLQIYNNMKQNPQYRRQFVDAYCILNGSVFTPERCEAIGDSICALVAPALAFEGKDPYTSYNEQKNNMTSDAARANRMQALRDCYGMGQGMNVEFHSNLSNASFRINNQSVPTNKFDGVLFAPVAIEVSAPAGYTFRGWQVQQSYAETPINYGDTWYYYDQASLDSQTTWTTDDASSWEDTPGTAPLGYGKDGINTTLDYGGNSSNKYPTYYFRKDITLSSSLGSDAEVKLNYVEDDGFIVYVNGTEAGRYNMPDGNVTYDTYATTYANSNPDRGTLTLPASLFCKGTNKIAVELHNNSANSSDIYWDAELTISSSNSESIVSTDRTLNLDTDEDMQLEAVFDPLSNEFLIASGQTPVMINEVSASNSIFANDYYKKNDWVELYNTTDEDIDVAGMYLSDNPDKPQKYQIAKAENSSSTIIPAHGYLVIWADKLDPLSQLHASFKLGNADGECVILSAENGSWKDSLTYMVHTGEESVGRYPDGGNRIYKMIKPTINAQNLLTSFAEWISGEDKDFNYEEYVKTATDAIHAQGVENTEYYTVDGMRTNGLQRGINIVRMTMSDGSVVTKKIVIK